MLLRERISKLREGLRVALEGLPQRLQGHGRIFLGSHLVLI